MKDKDSKDLPVEIDTEDNIIRTKPRKKGYMKYLILLIIILVGAKFVFDFAIPKDSNELEISGSIEFDATSKYGFASFDDYIIVCNNNGINAYDKYGKIKWNHEISFSDPALKVCDNKLIVTDVKQNMAWVFDTRGNIKNDVTFNLECISASVNKNGWVTAILKNKGYKAQVAVYNSNGDLQFGWNSANNNIISAELAEDNKTLAVAQIDSNSSTEANGVISLFDISTDGKPYCGKNVGSNVVSYIRWNGSRLMCVGNNQAFLMDSNGNDIYSYKYPGDIVYYNAKNEGLSVFAISETSTSSAKRTVIYIVNSAGKEIGKAELDGEVKSVDVSGSDVAVTCFNKIIILKSDGRVKNEYSLTKDISKGIMFNDFKTVFVVSGTGSEIITLK